MQKIIFFLAFATLGVTGYIWYQDTYLIDSSKTTINLQIRNKVIKAQVADSALELQRGLSGKSSLAPNTGMLFVFSSLSRPEIWMKDMKFAIDIIFIDGSGKIVELFENATPQSYLETPPRVFRTLEDAKYVLEVPAGTVDDIGIEVGLMVYGLDATNQS